ncbi:MAG: PepSY-associated TM helix domain-containing protein [Pseudomonadota bacterium]|jgi:hypothetical protein
MSWSANFWKKQLRQWHWISSAICLAALMLFAVTGITLNHAASIEAKPTTTTRNIALPAALRGRLELVAGEKPLPADLTEAIRAASGVDVANALPEVADSELFFDLRGPGTEGTLTIDTASGEAIYERTDRGIVAVLNDLHKGRNTGAAWSLFIDIAAIACAIFSLTGLGLLWVHAGKRPSTWPLTGLGLVAPVLLYAVFVHT